MRNQTRQAIQWGRFSSDKQSEGDSRERQDRLNSQAAKSRGIKIIAEYFDEGTSVKDGATPMFKKVVASLPEGVGIVCENLDRINRGHPWRAKAYIAEILEAGHFIVTSQDGREYTAESIGQLETLVMGDMSANVAYAENVKRKQRVRAAKDSALELARKGKPAPLGAWLPAHVRYDAETKTYKFNEENRAVIKRIFEEYVSGKGCGNIARGLNQDEIATFRRKKVGGWLGGVVSQILRCEGIIGTLIVNDERIPNAFPAAISEKLFYKVEAMFKANKSRHGNYLGERVNNILRGVCRCAKCGNPMRIYIGDGGVMRIQCNGYRLAKCDQKNMVQYPELEYEFAKWFVPHAKDALLGSDENSTQIETLETKRAALQNRIDKTLALLDDEKLPINEIKSRLAKLENERRILDEELSSEKAKQSTLASHPETFKELDKIVDGILENQDVRRRVATLIPSIVQRVDIDLSDKMFPSFTCHLVNGEKIHWQYDVDEFVQPIKGITKDGKLVLGKGKVTEGKFKRQQLPKAA